MQLRLDAYGMPEAPLRISGTLECTACHSTMDCTAADANHYLQWGWPQCCGHTMLLFTARGLPKRRVP